MVQKKATGEYYAGPNRWVSDFKHAKRFRSLSQAARAVGLGKLLKDCCIIKIQLDGEHYELTRKS
jgi:hypothetical protein